MFTMDILERILSQKKTEIEQLAETDRLARLREQHAGFPDEWRQSRHFAQTIARKGSSPHVIAEIKKASPSKGVIRPDFDPISIARAYEDGGAAALSVLTDVQFFQGSPDYLTAVRSEVSLPLLRKDFIISELQIEESYYLGADAILLIAAACTPRQLARLRSYAAVLGLDVLLEVHDEAELEVAIDVQPDLIGINNRDLHTFHTDLAICERLSPKVPAEIPLVGESGIHSYDDVERLAACGVSAVLVGESLMRQHDLVHAVRALSGRPGRGR